MKRAKAWQNFCAAPMMLALASCVGNPTAPQTVVSVGPMIGEPTTPNEFAGATILNVDRYRPTRTMPSCKTSELPHSEADHALQSALSQAQEYSTSQNGVGLIVLQNGAVVHSEFAEGAGPTTLTSSASMMKSVLGLTVGIALERGIITSIDDPVGDSISEWQDDPRGAIIMRDLLTMSSGLAPLSFSEFLLAPDANAAALNSQIAEEAGNTFYYNNVVSQLIGLILDRRVKAHGYAGYAEFLYSELWCPLGNGEARLWVDSTGMPRTYAGLHAGLEDWARIGELIRNKGRAGDRQIVPASWVEQMSAPSPANPRYGFQLWRAGGWEAQRSYNPDNPMKVIHSAPFAASDLVFFDGFGGQRVYVIPSVGLTIARTGDVSFQFDDAQIPNPLVSALSQQ